MIREGVGEEAEGILMKDDTTELRVDLVVEGSMEAPLRVQDRGDEVPMDHCLGVTAYQIVEHFNGEDRG
jgi:hypothetical protein